jgi:hypothetical protein
MYLVGYLQPGEKNEAETDAKIISPIPCQTGEEICLAVEKLCAAIDYDMDNFEPEIWDALKDVKYFDTNYVTIDLHGSPVLVDLIVGEENRLRKKFPFKE